MRVNNEAAGQAVNPAQLWQKSGMSRRATNLLPPVARPQLYTQQLSGCACHSDGLGLAYTPIGTYPLPDGSVLGDIVPSAGSGNISILDTITLGATFIPGIGPAAGMAVASIRQYISQFEQWLGIGQGRVEADLIVPTQNDLVYIKLASITDQIRIGQNPDLATLYDLWRQVWMGGVGFVEFVLLKTFTDRRASGQALNTVMPYIDGTCGYPEPVGAKASPGLSNCLTWGDGTIGGPGTNGMLGAIGRAIVAQGGTVQPLPTVTQAANQGYQLSETPGGPGEPTVMGLSTPMLVGLGALALFMFSKKAPRG